MIVHRRRQTGSRHRPCEVKNTANRMALCAGAAIFRAFEAFNPLKQLDRYVHDEKPVHRGGASGLSDIAVDAALRRWDCR